MKPHILFGVVAILIVFSLLSTGNFTAGKSQRYFIAAYGRAL